MLVRMLAGFVQAAAGIAVGVWWRQRHHVDGPGNLAEQFIHGAAQLFYFLFLTPWGWLALWLFFEGILRVLAAAMQQPFGSAPVTLVRAAWARRPQHALPDDTMTTSGDAIVIDSAHDYDWHHLTTVDVNGALYCVAREAGTTERPHRYRLTPIPHDHVVRTVTKYPTSACGESGRTGRRSRR